MPSYLIVANQTLSSPTLMEAVRERVENDEAHFHVVVPATPIPHALTWDEREAEAAAQERLTAVLGRLEAMGADAAGEVGCADPVAAAQDAIRAVSVDEVILSTLPSGVSRWLGQDVPARLRRAVSVPVTVVTAQNGS
jgi:Asp/Glu/hydantoin racemase